MLNDTPGPGESERKQGREKPEEEGKKEGNRREEREVLAREGGRGGTLQ